MGWIAVIAIAVLLAAYANGANDNFKGVATLFGSGTADYRKALRWATLMTFAGSVTACFFATRLVKTFTGKGLVPDALISHPAFLTAVAVGAGLTVLFAACFGIPVSTTHGLTGALAGAGFAAAGSQLGFAQLGKSFVMPLLLSPFMAVVLAAAAYLFMRHSRKSLGVTRKTCLCAGEKVTSLFVSTAELQKAMSSPKVLTRDPRNRMDSHFHGNDTGDGFPLASPKPWRRQASSGMTVDLRIPEVFVGNEKSCETKALENYEGRILGINVQSALDCLHFLSAGAVSFARGLNDTPKIVALLVSSGALGLTWNTGLVAVAMAAGGILGARKVAETVSHKITSMNHGQGFAANLVTSMLVIFASRWGLPVSTTHVSCGALFGIGLVNRKARWNVIGSILGAWVLTLPVAAALSAAAFAVFSKMGA